MRKIQFILIYLILCACDKRPAMPGFDVLLKDSSTVLNTRQIPKGKPILLFYFSPDCEHCQTETTDLLLNIDSLKNVRMYFFTSDDFSRLKVYDKHYKIYNHPNIVLGRDYRNALANHFNILSPPFSALYNKNKKLVAVFAGETKVSDLMVHLKSLQ
jgi:Redoxin.